MGKRGPRPVNIGELQVWENQWYWVFRDLVYGHREWVNEIDVIEPGPDDQPRVITHRQKVPGRPDERDVWNALLRARTVEEVKSACAQSRRWLNADQIGKPFVRQLWDHAREFLRAKRDKRFPRSNRLSTTDKQIDYLARAMAGITLRTSPTTAVGLLRKLKHPRKCKCWRCQIGRMNGWRQLQRERRKT